ncbi:lipoprotein [Candidatus Peregrinibacteria bacterium]|nr:lipoprotein [Candidatus Peregrinibacteria bacterium]
MKKILFLLIAVFILAGCSPILPASPSDPLSLEGDMAEADTPEWLGTWTRTAVYTDGELVTTEPATLTLNKDTYSSSTAACTTSGSLEAGDGTITLIMTQDGCPDNLSLPFTVTYTYTIEENEDGGETMTNVTGPVTETYVR